MIITVNGEQQNLEGSEITLSELLALNKVVLPDMVSVQINGKFVDQKDRGEIKVAENDEVDFLYFMGGGKAV